MRYSQLNYVVCPRCHEELTPVTLTERPCSTAPVGLAPCARVPVAGALVGPVPAWKEPTALGAALKSLACEAAPPERNYEVVVDTGLLTCAGCGAWFPVIGCVPELLSDHLRNWARDREWLAQVADRLPGSLMALWSRFAPSRPETDAGAHHKLAEIGLPAKIEDPAFWGPGYASPFNVGDAQHTWHLIRNFAVAEPLLELAQWETVLDVGCGFAWTTEWMLKSGYEPIGIDICRTYLEIGLERIGANRPHLLVADAERLPIRSSAVRAVLGFEAFHHVPDRSAAMREFGRVLADGCPVVLVEPGGAHEHAAVSVEAMEKYGTLEKGMEHADVEAYAKGSGLTECVQHHMLRAASARPGQHVQSRNAARLVANEVYTLRKGRRVKPSRIARLRRRLAPRLQRALGLLWRTGAEIRMSLDSPAAGATVAGAVLVTGWALDPQAPTDTGISAVHVWARRRDVEAAEPVFLGAATLGESRPDVAAAFGWRFNRSGYRLQAPGLGAGRYELTVHALSRRTNRWDDARRVVIDCV
jgi:SAM-dependent methyltransferase